MKLFSIHDSKAEAYFSPITLKSTGEALRAFQASCEDTNSNLYKYPSDFTLVEIGEFCENTAAITMLPFPRIISNASEYSTRPVARPASKEQVSATLKPLISELESLN